MREISGNLMSMLPSDIHPEMDVLQIQLWKQASPGRKIYREISFTSCAWPWQTCHLKSKTGPTDGS